MRWSKDAPTIDSFDTQHAYYWFRSPIFHHPVIVCVSKGSGCRTGPSGQEPPWQELNAEFPDFSAHMWRPQWPRGEWAGPIPQPQDPTRTS